jgi:ABC-type multidrug transport system permease subunit
VLARWRSFYREPGVLFWSFGFPLVLAIALGIAFRNRPPEPVLAGVVDGPSADAVLHELATSGDVRATKLDPAEADRALANGKVALLVVPGEPRAYRFDPERPESRLARAVVDDALQRAEGRKDTFAPRDEKVTERGSRYIDFLVPGLIGMGLMQGGLWGVGYVIVEMRTRKLMKRLLATPMKKHDFLLGFVLVRALFLLVELPVLLVFATLVFGVPIRGSIVLLASIATFGSLSFAGLGLLVASRAENIQTASGLINLASMPMLIASGTFFSSSRFPDVVQPFVRALPLTALNDALRAVMLDGASITGIGRELAILGAWGLLSFALALRVFRWR